MLIALLFLFLGGGSGMSELLGQIDHLEHSIKRNIEASEQRSETLESVKSMKKATKAYSKKRQKHAKSLLKIASVHGRDTVEIDALLELGDTDTQEFQRLIIDHIDELRSALSREQWELISPWNE